MILIYLEGLLYVILFVVGWLLLGWVLDKLGIDKINDNNHDNDDGMSTMMSGLC